MELDGRVDDKIVSIVFSKRNIFFQGDTDVSQHGLRTVIFLIFEPSVYEWHSKLILFGVWSKSLYNLLKVLSI